MTDKNGLVFLSHSGGLRPGQDHLVWSPILKGDLAVDMCIP